MENFAFSNKKQNYFQKKFSNRHNVFHDVFLLTYPKSYMESRFMINTF